MAAEHPQIVDQLWRILEDEAGGTLPAVRIVRRAGGDRRVRRWPDRAARCCAAAAPRRPAAAARRAWRGLAAAAGPTAFGGERGRTRAARVAAAGALRLRRRRSRTARRRTRRTSTTLTDQSLRFDRVVPESMPALPVRRTLVTGMRSFPFRDWRADRRACRRSPAITRSGTGSRVLTELTAARRRQDGLRDRQPDRSPGRASRVRRPGGAPRRRPVSDERSSSDAAAHQAPSGTRADAAVLRGRHRRAARAEGQASPSSSRSTPSTPSTRSRRRPSTSSRAGRATTGIGPMNGRLVELQFGSGRHRRACATPTASTSTPSTSARLRTS